MKKTARWLFVALLFIPSALLALETTSVRMKGLGEDFQGLVPDEYTDVLANPARQRYWRDRELHAKFGVDGNPTALGYSMGRIPVFVLAEGRFNRTHSESSTQSMPTFSPRLTVQRHAATSESISDSFDGAAISGVGSEAFGVGFGLYYQQDKNSSRSDSINTNATVVTASGKEVYLTETETRSDAEAERYRPSAYLGFHWRDASVPRGIAERDLILSVAFLQFKHKITSLTRSYNDNDPDGDGKDQFNFSITTPSYTDAIALVDTKDNPAGRLGAGFEFRTRSFSEDARSGALVSFFVQPMEVDQRKVSLNLVRSNAGSSHTEVGSEMAVTNKGTEMDYSGTLAVGGFRRIHPRVWVGAGWKFDGTATNAPFDAVFIASGTSISREEIASHSYTAEVRIPFSAEVELTNFLVLRGNVTPWYSYARINQDSGSNLFGSYDLTSAYAATGADFGAGLGAHWQNINVDIFTSSDLTNVSNIQAQVRYAFGGAKAASGKQAGAAAAPAERLTVPPAAAPSSSGATSTPAGAGSEAGWKE